MTAQPAARPFFQTLDGDDSAPPAAASRGALPDPALTPVERYVPIGTPTHRSGRAGWIVAATLLTVGCGLYVFRVAPLQRALDAAERTSAQQLKRHTMDLAGLSAELERERSVDKQLVAAKEPSAPAEPADTREATRAEPERERQVTREATRQARREATRQTRRERIAARRAARAARRAAHADGVVARAAASAAAASPESQTHDASPTTRTTARDSRPTQARDPEDALAGILSESDDPLRGL